MSAKKKELTFQEKLRKIQSSGLGIANPNRQLAHDIEDMPSIDQRVGEILDIVGRTNRPAGNMLFFIMYDIASNKVRNQVSKYLIKLGCHRVQKSIFLADLPSDTYERIKQDLTEVQAVYDNEDSILVVPVSTDLLKSMKIIGQNINVDVITHNKNTLFF